MKRQKDTGSGSGSGSSSGGGTMSMMDLLCFLFSVFIITNVFKVMRTSSGWCVPRGR